MQIQQHTTQPTRIEPSYVQPLENKTPTMKKKTFYLSLGFVFILLILVGVGTGYLLANPGKGSTTTGGQAITNSGGKAFGSSDTKTFTDSAIGTVEKEGISGEGTHKLIRDGGPSQTACLVSSVLDLDEFVGKKVKVYSKTMGAKQCPWLMDVGRIELQ